MRWLPLLGKSGPAHHCSCTRLANGVAAASSCCRPAPHDTDAAQQTCADAQGVKRVNKLRCADSEPRALARADTPSHRQHRPRIFRHRTPRVGQPLAKAPLQIVPAFHATHRLCRFHRATRTSDESLFRHCMAKSTDLVCINCPSCATDLRRRNVRRDNGRRSRTRFMWRSIRLFMRHLSMILASEPCHPRRCTLLAWQIQQYAPYT